MAHTWENYHVKLLDKDRADAGTLVNVHNLKGSVTLFGQYGAYLTFSININDAMASVFQEKTRHFIQVLRDGTSIWEGFTVKATRRYTEKTSGLAEFIEVTCLPLSQLVGWRHGQPVTGATLESSGRTADDGFKWLLERTHGATAPVSPTNSTVRQLTGFTLEADSTERAGNVTIAATGKNMYDLLLRMGARYEVDWWVEFDASFNTEFKTKYPRRGLDRTESNGARTEVIFNDSADTAKSVNYGYDAGTTITAAMNKPMTIDAEDSTLQTNWLYMETVIDTEDTEELEAELARRGVAVFYKSDFVERVDLVWDPSDSVTGPHFGIGDKITYVNKRLGYGPHDAIICKIEFEILANGEEKLTLTFGDPIPDVFDKQKSKRRAVAADAYTFLSYWRRDDATNELYPAYAEDSGPDHVVTNWGGDIRTYSDARSALTASIDGATGRIDSVDGYTKSGAAADKHVLIGDGTRGVFRALATGDLPAPAAHDILSAQHGDTVADAVTRGSLIYGNATPKWDELVKGATSTHLEASATDIAWQANITMADGATIGQAAGPLLTFDDTANDLELTGANLAIYVNDLELYSDAGTTLKFSADGAAGNLWTAGTITMENNKAFSMDDSGGTPRAVLKVSTGEHLLIGDSAGIGDIIFCPGAVEMCRFKDASAEFGVHVYPDTTATYDNGLTGSRWRDGFYSRNMDIDGTINVQGQGTFQANVDFGAGIDVTGNITVTGFVDTVDVAGHTHAISGDTATTQPALSGNTGSWATTGATAWAGSPLRTTAGTVIYIKDDSFNTAGGAGYTAVAIGSTAHVHNMAGAGGYGSITATAAVATHVHDAGDLITGAPVNP